jgi:hypothetical protein
MVVRVSLGLIWIKWNAAAAAGLAIDGREREWVYSWQSAQKDIDERERERERERKKKLAKLKNEANDERVHCCGVGGGVLFQTCQQQTAAAETWRVSTAAATTTNDDDDADAGAAKYIYIYIYYSAALQVKRRGKTGRWNASNT